MHRLYNVKLSAAASADDNDDDDDDDDDIVGGDYQCQSCQTSHFFLAILFSKVIKIKYFLNISYQIGGFANKKK